jgi:hypothetical protein
MAVQSDELRTTATLVDDYSSKAERVARSTENITQKIERLEKSATKIATGGKFRDMLGRWHDSNGRFTKTVSGFNMIAMAGSRAAGVFGVITSAASTLLGGIGRLAGGLMDFAGNILSTVIDHLMSVWKWLTIVAGVAAGFAARSVITATAEFERLSSVLLTLEGSSKKAEKAMSWATGFAKQTPFQLPEIVQSMSRLKAYGIDATKGALRTIGDFSAAMGRNILDGVEAVADALMGEWERMKEFGLKRDILETWMSKKGMPKAFDKQGSITNSAAMQAGLFAFMQQRASGAMLRMMDTLEGKWSNLKDAVWRASVAVGSAFSPHIKRLLDVAGQLIDNLFSPERMQGLKGWVDKLFSRDNVARVATFFANIYVFIKRIPEAFAKAWDAIVAALPGIGMKIVDFGFMIADVFNKAAQTVIGLVNPLIDAVNSIAYMFAVTIPRGQAQMKMLNPLKWGEARGELAGIDAIDKLWDQIKMPNIAAPRDLTSDDYHKWDSFVMSGFGLSPMMDRLKGAFANPDNTEASSLVSKFMSIWDKTGQQAKAADAAAQTAENTKKLVDQNERIINKMSGAFGPRTELLVRRFMFGGGNASSLPQLAPAGMGQVMPRTGNGAVPAGGNTSVDIRLPSGAKTIQDIAYEAIHQTLAGMGIPHTIRR